MADSDTEALGDGDGDALYVVAPEQFIATRDALARRLRSGGHKTEAAQVAKRRRPPLTAWALNQVARTAPSLIDALVVAGGQLRAATEDALAGDASGLRPARSAERSAVDAVVAAAVRHLERGGYAVTDVMRPRMAATLRAAVIDEAVADRLRHGVLEADQDAPGFGMDAFAPAPPAAESQQEDSQEQSEQSEQSEQAEQAQRLREAQAEASRLSAEAAELVAHADRLAAEAKQAGERATEARARADAAVQVAADAADGAEALAHD